MVKESHMILNWFSVLKIKKVNEKNSSDLQYSIIKNIAFNN